MKEEISLSVKKATCSDFVLESKRSMMPCVIFISSQKSDKFSSVWNDCSMLYLLDFSWYMFTTLPEFMDIFKLILLVVVNNSRLPRRYLNPVLLSLLLVY